MTGERILVVGPSWVGDMVMAQSLFKILMERGDATIDVVAPAWSLPIIARMPEVRRGISLDVKHGEFAAARRSELGRQLRGEKYTHAIILPRSFKSALVPWFARIPRRTGFRGEMRYGLLNDRRTLERHRLDQTVKRFVSLGMDDGRVPDNIPFPALTVDRQRQADTLARLGLDTARPVVAMMPGAEYGPAKCWPLEYFAELAGMLEQRNFSVWVLGSGNDHAAGEVIASNSPAINLCGETSLEDAVDLLGMCVHAVSNDSGLMHVAAAVGTTVHAIYGSSTPDYTPPLTDHRCIHYRGLECSPCFERQCPLSHMNCLRGILPEMVLNGIEDHEK